MPGPPRRSCGRTPRALLLVAATVASAGALSTLADGARAWHDVARIREGWTYRPPHARAPRTVRLATVPSIERLPPVLLLAVTSSEDRHFFAHRGFDLAELRLALADALWRGHPLRGASTITQQLARTLFLGTDRSLARKWREAVYTVALEHLLTKREILALYLDTVEWGDGIYGIRAATDAYFRRTPATIDLDEAALLATLLPAPTTWGPALQAGSWRRLGMDRVGRQLGRLHLLVDALSPPCDLSAAPMADLIDEALRVGLPERVRRERHRSLIAIGRRLRAARARSAAASGAPTAAGAS